jgi:hypothetical protein
MSYSMHWWRKGEKERAEMVAVLDDAHVGAGAMPPLAIETFDGATVRALRTNGSSVQGTINRPEAAGWGNSNRLQPWSLLFEFHTTPYWQLLKDSTEFEVLTVGLSATTVTFRHPVFNDTLFVLHFDHEHRLTRRDVSGRVEAKTAPRLYERHEFADYEAIEDASGELLWFPKRAIYHHYMAGPTDHPELEYTARTIDLASVTLNPEIPDSMFVLEFPEDVKVVDWSQGRRQELNPTREIPRFSAEDRSWLPAAGAIAFAFVLSGGCFLYARRRRRGGSNHQE